MKSTKTKARGEMSVTASKNGRSMTLDPIKTFSVPIELREVESTIACGFRQEWISADNGKKITLCAGAGCGSRWLTLSYGNRDFCVDMGEVLTQFVEAIAASSVVKP